MGEKPEPHPLDGRLEPEAHDVTASAADAALVSIAVSLKRIADVLQGDPQNMGIKHAVFDIVDRIVRPGDPQ